MLGSLRRVTAVLHVGTGSREERDSFVVEQPVKESTDVWDPPVDLVPTVLSEDEVSQVRKLLRNEYNTFTRDDNDIGCADGLQMPIELNDQVPVHSSYMAVPKPLLQEVKDYVNNLLNTQRIRKSTSQYTSQVVCVRKKDGTLRMCVDYRRRNAKTIQNQHPIPRVQVSFDSLGDSKWFSLLGHSKAYHHGFIQEKCRKNTAFSTAWGQFEWNRIPFGLTRAPGVCQAYMNKTREGLRDTFCLPYLDDILVYSKSFKEQLKHLKSVFQRHREQGLKLKPSKCHPFQKGVRYLGYLITTTGPLLTPQTQQL